MFGLITSQNITIMLIGLLLSVNYDIRKGNGQSVAQESVAHVC